MNKYGMGDRLKPISGSYNSYLFVVTNYYYDEELNDYVYETYGVDSPSVIHYFAQSDVEFSGNMK